MKKPEEVKSFEFEVSVLGGYKRETVDMFFSGVANDYEELYKEKEELVKNLKKCVEKIEEYQKDEKYLKDEIVNYRKLNENSLIEIEAREKEIIQRANEKAESLLNKAKIEAESMLNSAKTDAENIINNAKAEAAEAIATCEKEAQEKITRINKDVIAEQCKLDNIKKEISSFKKLIIDTYKEHVKSLSELPGFCAEPEEKAKETEKIVDYKPVSKKVSETIEDTKPVTVVNDNVSKLYEIDEENTAEFVINKKPAKEEVKDSFEESSKFDNIKFGPDYDVKNDND